MIFTGTKKGVLSFKIGMFVEVHQVPPLYSRDTQILKMTFDSCNPHSILDLVVSLRPLISCIPEPPICLCEEQVNLESLGYMWDRFT
mgnify:CR=1 FL=1